LPARDGRPCYIAGTAHSEWSGVTLYPLQVTDEKLDAATWADRIAEIEAEKERDYRAASSARVAFDEKAEELAAVRTERRGLQRELRRARLDAKEHGLKTAPTLCAVIREKISALVERAEELAKERRELDATFSGQPGWQN
jgi:chromosome segregation ATPase